jgi:pyruvate dehydrogenase E1 component alpha subunit
MFGDGATNIGYFHEALNLAKIWGLRILWVCENNVYGMGTSVERASAVAEIRQRAEGYNMKSGRVDGMDIMKVYEAAKEALDYVRENSQPYLLEVMTYRYRGHSMGDPERYRKPEEVKKWQETDPIGIFRKHLLEKKTISSKALDEIDAQVEEEVNKAVEFAETSPEPAMEELFTDIYVDVPEVSQQQSETSPSESLVAER